MSQIRCFVWRYLLPIFIGLVIALLYSYAENSKEVVAWYLPIIIVLFILAIIRTITIEKIERANLKTKLREAAKSIKEPRIYPFWVVINRAEDLEGAWVGHALNFDVVTYAYNIAETVRMTMEAVAITLTDDLEIGANPYDRRAPTEFWDKLWEITRVRLSSNKGLPPDDEIEVLVTRCQVTIQKDGQAKLPPPNEGYLHWVEPRHQAEKEAAKL